MEELVWDGKKSFRLEPALSDQFNQIFILKTLTELNCLQSVSKLVLMKWCMALLGQGTLTGFVNLNTVSMGHLLEICSFFLENGLEVEEILLRSFASNLYEFISTPVAWICVNTFNQTVISLARVSNYLTQEQLDDFLNFLFSVVKESDDVHAGIASALGLIVFSDGCTRIETFELYQALFCFLFDTCSDYPLKGNIVPPKNLPLKSEPDYPKQLLWDTLLKSFVKVSSHYHQPKKLVPEKLMHYVSAQMKVIKSIPASYAWFFVLILPHHLHLKPLARPSVQERTSILIKTIAAVRLTFAQEV